MKGKVGVDGILRGSHEEAVAVKRVFETEHSYIGTQSHLTETIRMEVKLIFMNVLEVLYSDGDGDGDGDRDGDGDLDSDGSGYLSDGFKFLQRGSITLLLEMCLTDSQFIPHTLYKQISAKRCANTDIEHQMCSYLHIKQGDEVFTITKKHSHDTFSLFHQSSPQGHSDAFRVEITIIRITASHQREMVKSQILIASFPSPSPFPDFNLTYLTRA